MTFANEGTVQSVELEPPFADTEAGRCVEREMTRVVLPRFDGEPVAVKKAFSLAKSTQSWLAHAAMKQLMTIAATAAAATKTGFFFKCARRVAETAIGEGAGGRIDTGGAPQCVQYASPFVV